MNKTLLIMVLFALFVSLGYSANQSPVTGIPTLSPTIAYDITPNIYCLNSSTNDSNNDTVSFYYTWFKNGVSLFNTGPTITTETPGFGLTELVGDLDSHEGGIRILVSNITPTVTKVTKYINSTAQVARIYNLGFGLLAQSTFSGQVAIFNITLSPNTGYYVFVATDPPADYKHYGKNGVSYPINSTNNIFQYISSWLSSYYGETTTQYRDIQSMDMYYIHQTGAVSSSNLTNSSYTGGDSIICQITPTDGILNGTSKNSSALTINGASFYGCSNGTAILNFTFYSQDAIATLIPSNMSATFTFKVINSTATFNTSLNWTNVNSAAICGNIGNLQYTVSSIQTFTGADGTYRNLYYYLLNLVVSNTTQNISLFNLKTAGSMNIKYTINQDVTAPVQGGYLQIYRYYPGTNQLLLVSMGITDNNGFSETYIVPNDVTYQYQIYKDGLLKYVSTTNVVPCDTGTTQCLLRILISAGIQDVFLSVAADTGTGCWFNSTTRIAYCTTANPSGTSTGLNIQVFRKDTFSDVLVCSNSITSTTGTVVCSVPNDNSTYYIWGYTTIGSRYSWGFFVNPSYSVTGLYFGDYGMIGGIFMIGVFALLGAAIGVSGVIVGGLLGMILASIIGLIPFTYSVIIAVCIAGLVLAFILRDK